MYRSKTPPKNIIISHVYSSDNKGDAALTSVLVQDLRRRFPRAELRILALDVTKAKFEGVAQRPAFMNIILNKYHSPLAKLAYALYVLPTTLLWAVLYRWTKLRLPWPDDLREIAELYAQADFVVAVGGGYIRSREGLVNRLNIPLLLHPLLFGYLLGKPTILYAQSIGPFTSWYEPMLVRFVLRRMTLIMLREDTSMALAKRIGVTRNIVRAVDSGFLLRGRGKVNIREKYHIPLEQLVLGVTVRSWLKGEAQIAYEQAVAAALDVITEQYKVHALFIPQVTAGGGDDDREASQRVHGYMRRPNSATVVTDTPDHHRIKSMYDELDALLGTRFHSVIFSLTSFVPVVAIEYEHKTSGIMRDLNLEDWVVHIEDVTEQKLTALLHRLFAHRGEYQADLRARVAAYVGRAEQAIELLTDAVQKP